ncbi:30S ribosomal protein S3 [Candidatus Micrarchaeota archaeon]|nr:30S ribosomal protein S3 [Candidatus Micrarchaeota archaeon]
MAIEKKFIQQALADLQIKTLLNKELDKAGVSEILIQKTPIATRITVRVRRPGLVVGKKGKAIKELCELLERRFAIENPQFEVIEVAQPSLDARLMAEKIGRRLEMRPNAKPIMRMALREIMDAGALGAELQAAGKIVGKGGKAKTLRMRAGYLKKSGEPTKWVRKGHFVAYLKAGAVGISVKIVPPDAVFPDSIKIPATIPEKVPVQPVEETVAAEANAVDALEAKPDAEEKPKKTRKAPKPKKQKALEPAEAAVPVPPASDSQSPVSEEKIGE